MNPSVIVYSIKKLPVPSKKQDNSECHLVGFDLSYKYSEANRERSFVIVSHHDGLILSVLVSGISNLVNKKRSQGVD
jgi:hypothetical protein